MYKNLRWKFIAIVAVAAVALVAFYPPSLWGQKKTRLHLGLDLQGGVHLVLQVNTDDALKVETSTSMEQFAEALKTAGVTVTPRLNSPTEFQIDGVPADKDTLFRQTADQQAYTADFDRENGVGGSYTFRMKPNIIINLRRDTMTQAQQTIERRVNELGVSEPVVAPYGTSGDKIVVQLPGLTEIARAKALIQNTAFLEMKMVEAGPADKATLLQPYGGQVPPDMEMVPLEAVPAQGAQPGAVSYYLLHKVAAITGRDLRTAREKPDEFNRPSVGFTLNNQGVDKFSKVTSANVGRQIAIVLDGQVRSAPRVDGPINTADASITGTFTMQEASDLALVLRSGALPASLTSLEQQEIGPTLGADSIRAGVMASVTGLALVAIFMLVYYRLAGINAIVSVTMNLIILLGCMAYVGAVMTLPGIAGFILTIGMGVDSNVLIFERIREEMATNKGVRQALGAGFDRVFITIVDTHVSSLIAAAFLFQFGTGPIRGFATTLFFGLISNVFTAVFVSRTLFEFILSRKPAGVAKLSI
jgi:preprotein translocase subunit SecD